MDPHYRGPKCKILVAIIHAGHWPDLHQPLPPGQAIGVLASHPHGHAGPRVWTRHPRAWNQSHRDSVTFPYPRGSQLSAQPFQPPVWITVFYPDIPFVEGFNENTNTSHK